MNKILIAAAAVLAITGSAFAGSDNYGSNGANQPAAAVDQSYTASTKTSEPAAQTPAQGSDRNLFGR
ncbi:MULTISPECIES: DUF680 domain-containing protein [Mesorhizobium]|jgi:hypothetical protein|uniref:DUF680 domain-containing protein n=1 Tax=Mesorhizobium TaxID=68287 RepID=UPI000FCAC05F|nr:MULTISPECIES: DUF680 domain-containing protein [Mesorhizobium]AZV18462.1 DUF680 domain-containing protein [Mesorhizobium sp. M7A.F.Ce.TU.012.03.2.1]MCF6124870.1 DUF680 domain-containing protein [Mesorhizobium ciceri]MCQ8814040.1 DUF680 domain-containing protein [Mesorhizobium sp. SEMIA396]RUX84557.1 DUF680 domain-containing protein [Mesorhizobium sp. M7A.F.Ca.CA.004.08.1.1]RUY02601.1 DUF680 domain-containing protein [Mesorhizobium sp. M7A.F.Ca.CA.004.04.1.1]